MAPSPSPFPSSVMSEAVYWGQFLSQKWLRDFSEAPTKLHTGVWAISDDGTPQWQRAFINWLDGVSDDAARSRTTKVMRRLRRIAPRSYEVLYRAMILGQTFDEITVWLNERALRNNIPLPTGKDAHYRLKDAVALFIAGVDYARAYW